LRAIGTASFSVVASNDIWQAFEILLWIAAGLLVATAALIILLPLRAREGPRRSR